MSAHIDLHVTARALLTQPPPPSLREILGAYRTKGDGDREMLLAMLNAKAAEEQSHANRTALCRSLLEANQYSSSSSYALPSPHMHEYYPSPSASEHSPPQRHAAAPSKRDEQHYHHHSRRSHSPYSPPMADSRKRQRTSHSPPRPYSPVSSTSSVTDSPRQSRPSMSIGALLSSHGARPIPNQRPHSSEDSLRREDSRRREDESP